jgi:hypothetical protein
MNLNDFVGYFLLQPIQIKNKIIYKELKKIQSYQSVSFTTEDSLAEVCNASEGSVYFSVFR